jgi:prepilin-type N-terminal cleavage/methylation domain-containing protein
MNRGFTLIELLLVIAITSILAAASTPFLSQFLLRNYHDTTVDKVIGSIRQAQNHAQNNKRNLPWGICLVDNNIRIFAGSVCTSSDYHQDFTYPSTISISGFSTTTFNNRGEPNSPLNITISSSLDSNDINLNSVGGLIVE